jgi:hypothetical protein
MAKRKTFRVRENSLSMGKVMRNTQKEEKRRRTESIC